MKEIIRNLSEYRELLKTSIRKELRGKYKGSFLGVLWSFINPLLMVFVYWIIFPFLLAGGLPDGQNYLIYLITGVLPWNFFTTVIQQGITTIRANAGIIKKVYFPREILPISVAVSGLINFFISCIIILVFCIGTGTGISWHIIFVFIIAIVQFVLSLGLTLALCAMNIYVKDLEYVIAFVLNMMFYATPIVYHISKLKQYAWILKLNPMTIIINSYRDIFLYHQIPNLTELGAVAILSFLILIVGYKIFNHLQKGFAEEV